MCLDRVVDAVILQSHVVPMVDLTPTLFLDIDLCTFYGQDFNGIITVLQELEKDDQIIKTLMKKLVNPAMISTIGDVLESHKDSRICLYTSKRCFIQDGVFPDEMIKDCEVYIPLSMSLENCLPDCKFSDEGLKKGLIRLFKCREVVQEVLGLRCLPELIITAVEKNVKRACTRLAPPTNPEYAFLWDDNFKIAGKPHVIIVPAYTALSVGIGSEIERDLEKFEGELDTEFKAKLFKSRSPCYRFKENRFYVNKTAEVPVDWPIPSELSTPRAL